MQPNCKLLGLVQSHPYLVMRKKAFVEGLRSNADDPAWDSLFSDFPTVFSPSKEIKAKFVE